MYPVSNPAAHPRVVSTHRGLPWRTSRASEHDVMHDRRPIAHRPRCRTMQYPRSVTATRSLLLKLSLPTLLGVGSMSLPGCSGEAPAPTDPTERTIADNAAAPASKETSSQAVEPSTPGVSEGEPSATARQNRAPAAPDSARSDDLAADSARASNPGGPAIPPPSSRKKTKPGTPTAGPSSRPRTPLTIRPLDDGDPSTVLIVSGSMTLEGRLNPSQVSCSSDADCRPACRCHPSTCVSVEEYNECAHPKCTANCPLDTMSCGGGCLCQDGLCTAAVVTSR